jgi:hypothetical protein
MSMTAEEMREQIITREARRVEIIDWLQEEIGTAWECARCGHYTYHAVNAECGECGEPFPLLNLLAFKLHAGATENEEYLDRARALMDTPPPSDPWAEKLAGALADLLSNYDEERQAIDVEPDAGCIECTVGTVPNDRNTGLCAFHRARAALEKARS